MGQCRGSRPTDRPLSSGWCSILGAPRERCWGNRDRGETPERVTARVSPPGACSRSPLRQRGFVPYHRYAVAPRFAIDSGCRARLIGRAAPTAPGGAHQESALLSCPHEKIHFFGSTSLPGVLADPISQKDPLAAGFGFVSVGSGRPGVSENMARAPWVRSTVSVPLVAL